MIKKLASILLLTALTWGCSTPPTADTSQSPTPQVEETTVVAEEPTPSQVPALVPEGWTEVKSKDGKTTLALPPNWIVADSENPEFVKNMAVLKKENPALAEVDTSAFYFMALDTEIKNDFADNLNIAKQTLPQVIPFDQETAEALKQEFAKTMPIQGEMQMAITEVPQGSAYRYEAILSMSQGEGKTLNTFLIGYIVFQGTDMYIISFSTTPDNREDFAKTTQQLMGTLKIAP